MGELSEFQVGQPIELSDGRAATIQFVGKTHFATGNWVGVELQDASGKNDGEVQGQRYFDCPQGYGMFVRPAAVTVLEQPISKPTPHLNGSANGVVSNSRPSSAVVGGSKRQSILDPVASKRQSMNAASPSPDPRVSRLASPSKSPTKQIGSAASSGPSSRTGTPSSQQRKSIATPAKTTRTSMGPPPPPTTSRAPRPSITGTPNGPPKPTSQESRVSRGISTRQLLRPAARDQSKSINGDIHGDTNGEGQSPADSPKLNPLSPSEEMQAEQQVEGVSPASALGRVVRASPEKPSLSRGLSSSSTSQRPPPHITASNREIEDLKTKLRVIEKKRVEDREKLKAMDKIQAERDKFEGIIQKLQAKYQPQQQELADLKHRIREEQDRIATLEGQIAENEGVMEVATLDREMAEEAAESVKLELETLRQKHEEIELELTVLREENEELGREISPEDKTSQGWLQLERSNERLREALMRLRDMTQEQEADLKSQIAELEKDVQQLSTTKEEGSLIKESLNQASATIDVLRQQLETALVAEDMIEELTEKNTALDEKMEEMKMTIEDLESLKELNDELEVNHTETEKQLQEEIDYNEALLSEETKKAAIQDGTIQDLEYTVSRFRDLVANMQSDLEDMRASQQITESEANELSARSRAMMDLNMRLQTSASKAQFKAVDLELDKMRAQEALEHLSIVQLFLPDNFKSEQDSVQAILCFRRLGFKAQMMHGFVKERINSALPATEDDIVIHADILDKLAWVSSTCDRLINNIQTCNLETFRRLGGARHELEPVERAFNSWIESVKRNEFKAEQCAAELQRSIALMGHIVDIHINDDLEHFPDKILAQALVMQARLENAAITLAHLKDKLETTGPIPDTESNEDDEYLEVFQTLDRLISSSRSAKVVCTKAIRQLEELKSRSLTLNPSTFNVVEQTQESTLEFSSIIRSFCVSVLTSVNEMQETNDRPSQIAPSMFLDVPNISILSTKMQSTVAHLQTFYNLTNTLSQTLEFPSPPPLPPWKLLAQKMREETADLATREKELGKLKDEVSEKNTTLAIKDKILEELSVKSEVLEKRVGESDGRRERVRELESATEAFRAKEKDYVSKLTQLRKEIEKLESERERWKKASQAQPSASPPDEASNAPPQAAASATSLLHLDYLKSEIAALQSSVRYLRSASHQTLMSHSHTYLSTPLVRPSPKPRPIEMESRDVLREMLHHITEPAIVPVKLQPRTEEDRLKWRPVKETSAWQAQRQREEWEEWREWRDGVAQRGWRERKEEGRRRDIKARGKLPTKTSLAKVGDLVGGEVAVAEVSESGDLLQSVGSGEVYA